MEYKVKRECYNDRKVAFVRSISRGSKKHLQSKPNLIGSRIALQLTHRNNDCNGFLPFLVYIMVVGFLLRRKGMVMKAVLLTFRRPHLLLTGSSN